MVRAAKEVSWQTWALALFVTLALSFGGAAWADAKSDIKEISEVGSPVLRERLGRVETAVDTHQQQYLRDLQDLKERMRRIEEKQDELLRVIKSQ